MHRLRLTLLGGFSLQGADGAEVKLPTLKTRALLAYLAYHVGNAQSREKLASLLWGDRGERQARQSLNSALKAIRAAGAAHSLSLVESDRVGVALVRDAIDIDVDVFHRLIQTVPLAAAPIYTGPFLDGFAHQGSAFEDWTEARRRELAREISDGLMRGSAEAEHRGDMNAAIDAAERIVAFDPLREDVHCRLMALHAANGDRVSAIRQFQTCRDALIRELGVEPNAETIRLHSALIGNSGSGKKAAIDDRAHESASQPVEKPSIAVLPFEMLTTGDSQQIIGDGVAGDIIAGLSRFRWLHVIARASTFTFRGGSNDPSRIACALGVRYLSIGTIGLSGQKMRIATELVDCTTGACLWAENFNKDLDDLFLVQDEITSAIVQRIVPEIERQELLAAQFKRPTSRDAWSVYQRGLAAFHSVTEENLRKAITLFERSVEIDPGFAAAHAHAAAARMRLISGFRPDDAKELTYDAQAHVNAALQLDIRDYTALFVSGVLASFEGRHTIAEERVRQSLDQNPNAAVVWAILCFVLRRGGKPTEALVAIEHAIRLSPLDPEMAMFMANRTTALFDNGRYSACVESGFRTIDRPDAYASTFATLAAALVKLGRLQEAANVLVRMWERYPDYSFDRLEENRRTSHAASEQGRADILYGAGLIS